MKKYNPLKIERKWQRKWEELDVFRAKDRSKKPKFYLLVEFPYPSGQGLHVGHSRSYIGLDILARKKRMEGFNVLYPMGWDAFGLPTENYAIRTGIHPAIATKKNTANFKRQEKKIGLSFDWSREINTTDPDYYKWTQWIFVQLFKKGLAYKAKMAINWCPACKIGLANEEVIDGNCERCGERVVKKEKEQWMLKITKYADRLIDDLKLVDYPERVKISQKEWIGRSEGIEIRFPIFDSQFSINVFTTRPDTLFGCTYLVLAPEHPLIEKLKDRIRNYRYVSQYIERAKRKIERERISEAKEKTGIELKGVKAVNPINNREIPIFVADYVLIHYGTGAIMAVPAHDQRDFDFAKQHNLAIIEVIEPNETKHDFSKQAYEGEGILINSERFNGMKSQEAIKRIGEYLIKRKLGKKAIHYKLRDWIFSRQRYWGEPIPIIYCRECFKTRKSKSGFQNLREGYDYLKIDGKEHAICPVPEEDLPVKLPKVKEYKPTKEGQSPLAQAERWVKVACPKCGSLAQRETDVMPNWAGSNWYFLRYCDAKNDKELARPKLLKYWLPVDWYNGGMEHTTLHLLYSRFIYKFLWDIKAVPREVGPEPYKKRTSHGIILGEKGVKMSKSKGNVFAPDEIVEEYGADTLRIYEMFMGPFEQMVAWNSKGIKGVRRFLEKVWKFGLKALKNKRIKTKNNELKKLIHKTIKKVGEDIESLKFNTAISSLMVLVNKMEEQKELSVRDCQTLIILLHPFAPHITEELWEMLGLKRLCCQQKWPRYNAKLIKEEKNALVIQIDGKVRDKIEAGSAISKEKAQKLALSQPKIQKWLKNREIKKTIFVPGKLINIVTK